MSHPYRVERTKNRHSRAVLHGDVIVIRLARNLGVSEEQRHVDSLLRRMIAMLHGERRRIKIDPHFPVSKEHVAEITDLVRAINASTMNATIRKVRLRPMRSQWGSCSPRGDISLNTALLKLPHECLEYVIVHELAHRTYAGHGPRFWALVRKHCPDVERIRKELRRYRVVHA